MQALCIIRSLGQYHCRFIRQGLTDHLTTSAKKNKTTLTMGDGVGIVAWRQIGESMDMQA